MTGESRAMPGQDQVVVELRKIRERGLLRIRSLTLPAIDALANTVFPDTHDPARRIEEVLRRAVDQLGGTELTECAGVLFGLVTGYRGTRPADLRRKAAEVRGVGLDAFRKSHEPLILEDIASAMLLLATAEKQRSTATPDEVGDEVSPSHSDAPVESEGSQSEVFQAQLGRRATWQEMFARGGLVRAIDLSMPLFGTPALIDHIETAAASNQGEFRILLMNPASFAAHVRARSTAYKTTDELFTTIEYVLRILRGLHISLESHSADAASRFDVRLFDTMPGFCGTLNGDRAYVSMYMDHLTGSRGPYFEVRRDRALGPRSLLACLESSFDYLWLRSGSVFASNFLDDQARRLEESKGIASSLMIPDYFRGYFNQ